MTSLPVFMHSGGQELPSQLELWYLSPRSIEHPSLPVSSRNHDTEMERIEQAGRPVGTPAMTITGQKPSRIGSWGLCRSNAGDVRQIALNPDRKEV